MGFACSRLSNLLIFLKHATYCESDSTSLLSSDSHLSESPANQRVGDHHKNCVTEHEDAFQPQEYSVQHEVVNDLEK